MAQLKTAEPSAMQGGPKWDHYRYFLAVAKTESVTGAAQFLRESAPTVSRRIRELEAHFADALFSRRPGRLVLTQAGARLRERLAPVDAEFSALHSDMLGAREKPKGHVTIAAPKGFGKAVLLECLGRLRKELPDVTFTTLFKLQRANLKHREADIAIRIGEPGAEGMQARHLGDVTFSLYASAKYVERVGPPSSLADLQAEDYIGLAGGENLIQSAEMRELAPHLSPGVSVDCILLQAQSVALGLGFAPLPDYMTASFSGMVRILPGALEGRAGLWILTQPDFANSPCVRATLPALISATEAAIAPASAAPSNA